MKNEFQDLHWGRTLIQARIKENKNHKGHYGTSLSGLFTMLRRHPRLSLIGDYPLLWLIVDETKSINNLKRALHKSEEYRQIKKSDKMKWYVLLSTPIILSGNATKLIKHARKTAKKVRQVIRGR